MYHSPSPWPWWRVWQPWTWPVSTSSPAGNGHRQSSVNKLPLLSRIFISLPLPWQAFLDRSFSEILYFLVTLCPKTDRPVMEQETCSTIFSWKMSLKIFYVLHTSKINYLHRQLHCLEKKNPWSIFTRRLTNYYRFSINVHVTRCQTTFSSRPKDTKRKVHRANSAHSTVGTEGTPVFWIYWFICDI